MCLGSLGARILHFGEIHLWQFNLQHFVSGSLLVQKVERKNKLEGIIQAIFNLLALGYI